MSSWRERRPALFFAPAVNNVIHWLRFVNSIIHQPRECIVDYKEATDRLFKRITAADLARELGVSQNAVARARLDPATRDYRPPPANWQAAVAGLADHWAGELLKLKDDLERLG